MAVLGLVALFLVIIVLQVPPLIKQQYWRDLSVFSALLILSMVLSFALVLDLPMANPNYYIEKIFTPVTHYLDELINGILG